MNANVIETVCVPHNLAYLIEPANDNVHLHCRFVLNNKLHDALVVAETLKCDGYYYTFGIAKYNSVTKLI